MVHVVHTARQKRAARSRTRRYLLRGIIDRQGCLVCGCAAEMHHPDYARPWLVTWLCRWHHEGAHRPIEPGQTLLWLGA